MSNNEAFSKAGEGLGEFAKKHPKGCLIAFIIVVILGWIISKTSN